MKRHGKRFSWFLFFLALNTGGCGSFRKDSQESSVTKGEQSKTPLLEIDIPKEDVNPQDLKRLGLGLRNALKEGTEKVPLKEIIDMLELEGAVLEVIPGILESHPGPITVTCKGLVCNASSSGKAHSFVAEFIDLPILGIPTIYLDPSISMELAVSNDGESLEICKITGIQAKASSFGGNLDGFIFKVKDQEVETLKIDIGFGGRYPNDRCKIK